MSNYQIIDPNFNYTQRQIRSAFQPLESIPVKSLTNETSSSLIFDLKKYKNDYFLSKLIYPSDVNFGKFSTPSGIATLPDDRLLVGNFSSDSLLLLDLNGTVYQVYRDIQAPKDVIFSSTNPMQAIIATRREVTIFDLEKTAIVQKSTIKGFYPWNIQFLQEHNVISACDPSGERLFFLDSNLNQVGGWSFSQGTTATNPSYEKIYPYAACFFSNNTSFVLTHRGQTCELKQCDSRTGAVIKTYPTPRGLLSFGMCVVEQSKCLIADIGNHSLLLVDSNETFEQYQFKSVREPYSMTFLSDNTLCVTDRNTLSGTNGGIAVLTEVPLTKN